MNEAALNTPVCYYIMFLCDTRLLACFPEGSPHFSFRPEVLERSSFSTSLTVFGVVIIIFNNSNTCVTISHFRFNLHFPGG